MTVDNNRIVDDTYLDSVIEFYLRLPDTPIKPSHSDRLTAASFQAQGVSLLTVENALLLASVRRLARPSDAMPLPPIRSLAYFVPVIEELSAIPLPDDYRDYLVAKLRKFRAR